MARAVAIYVGGQDRLVGTMLAGRGPGLDQIAVADDGRSWRRSQRLPTIGGMWSSWQQASTVVDVANLPDRIENCIRILPRDGSVEADHLFDGKGSMRIRLPK
jgi:hypothetical protein